MPAPDKRLRFLTRNKAAREIGAHGERMNVRSAARHSGSLGRLHTIMIDRHRWNAPIDRSYIDWNQSALYNLITAEKSNRPAPLVLIV